MTYSKYCIFSTNNLILLLYFKNIEEFHHILYNICNTFQTGEFMEHYANLIIIMVTVFVIYVIFRFIKNLFFTKIVILIILILAFFAGKYVFGIL